MLANAEQTGAPERGGMVGEAVGAQAGEHAEGEVETADKDLRGDAHNAGRDAEFGDEPEASGSKAGGDCGGEGFDLRLTETIEQEVSDREVVFRWRCGREIADGVGVMGLQPGTRAGCGSIAAGAEEAEHGRADVDCVSGERAIPREQGRKEAAVAISQDKRASAAGKFGKEVEAAAPEGAAQSDVFKPAVGAGYAVEVGVRSFQLTVVRSQ